MARIEWSRYKGDVEHAVAMFIGSDYPTRAEHIKPSKGDGGVDILVHGDDGYAVYQVKNFTQEGRPRNLRRARRIRSQTPWTRCSATPGWPMCAPSFASGSSSPR